MDAPHLPPRAPGRRAARRRRRRRGTVVLRVLVAVVALVAVASTVLVVLEPWTGAPGADDDAGAPASGGATDSSGEDTSDPSTGSSDGSESPHGTDDTEGAEDTGASSDASDGDDTGATDEGPVTADLDGDGFGDIRAVWARRVERTQWRYTRLDLAGGKRRLSVEQTPIDTFEDRVYADWDGDGEVEDLTYRASEDGKELWIKSDDDAIAAAEYPGLGLAADAPYVDLVAGDFDGDGDVDAAVHGQQGTTSVAVWLLENDGEGTFADPEPWITFDNADWASTSVLAGRFDDDDADDLAVLVPTQPLGKRAYDGPRAWRLLSWLAPDRRPGVKVPTKVKSWSMFVTGDFVGDGTTQIAVVTDRGEQVVASIVAFDGVRERVLRESRLGRIEGLLDQVTVSDVDGDGHDDLVYLARNGEAGAYSDVLVSRWAGPEGLGPGLPWAEGQGCPAEACYLYFQDIATVD